MTIACDTWLRRDFLLSHGHQPDEPVCSCPDCPRHTLPETPSEVVESETRRYGDDR